MQPIIGKHVMIFERLQRRLQEAGVPFDIMRHEPVFTSEEAARVRGAPLASGAKALICKVAERFVMFVMPADMTRIPGEVNRLDNQVLVRIYEDESARALR